MHPDFWLVLLRLARPGLIAVLGTVPMVILILAFTVNQGLFSRDFLLLVLLVGTVWVASALPMLVSEELPESWSRSRCMAALRVLYVLGPIPLMVACPIATVIVPEYGPTASVTGLLDAMLEVIPRWSLPFFLVLGTPLAADHLRWRFEALPEDSLAYRWRLPLLSHLAGLVSLLGWSLVALFGGSDLDLNSPSKVGVVLAYVMLWPVNLGLARMLVDLVIHRIDEYGERQR